METISLRDALTKIGQLVMTIEMLEREIAQRDEIIATVSSRVEEMARPADRPRPIRDVMDDEGAG